MSVEKTKNFTSNMSSFQSSYSVLSLFCGAGGLDLGFEAEGFSLLEAIDINPWCVKTLQKNRPEWKVVLGDVRSYLDRGLPFCDERSHSNTSRFVQLS